VGLPLALASLAVAASSAFVLTSASAGTVSNSGNFEGDDANMSSNGSVDWNSFAPVTWQGAAPYRIAQRSFTEGATSGWTVEGLEDATVSAGDSAFAGGVKQDNDCGLYKASKAPNKDDLSRIYMATKNVGGTVYLGLGWTRIPQNSATASAHVGFEFNKATTKVLNTTACPASPLTRRTVGDMLVVYDFEGGSAAPSIKLARWLTSASPAGSTCEVGSASVALGCWGNAKELTTLGYAEGKVTTGAVPDALRPNGAANPGAVEFGEAIINLTGAGVFSSQSCDAFGRAYAVTRSSGSSAQAAMEDIVGPGAFTVTNCTTLSVAKTSSDGGSQVGAGFTLYSGSTTTAANAVDTCTVNASGSCIWATSGTGTLADVQPGRYTIDETSGVSGYTKPSTLPETFNVSAGVAVNKTYENAADGASVSISKVDDANSPLAGAVFTLYQGSGTTTPYASCTTDAAGACVWTGGASTLTGVPAGSYTLDETPPLGYDKPAGSALPLALTLANGDTKVLPFSNDRLFKVITVVCQQAGPALYPSAVTVNGTSAGNSLSSTQASNAGVDVAKLCGLSAGARSGLKTGSASVSAVIGKSAAS
jgi:hypothetical protein